MPDEIAYKILVNTRGEPFDVVDSHDRSVTRSALDRGTGGEVVGVEVVEILAIRDPTSPTVYYCPHVRCILYCREQRLASQKLG